ncbi:MAG: outer membrane protein assembly factor BamD [Deltaproteobacteria bacterium]|nr:outer membrane protein assembly factor BamD [Deltaproteobacteria bacterium]
MVNFKSTLLITMLMIISLGFSSCGWWKSSPPLKNSPDALYQKGYEYYHRGKYEKAISSFRRVIEEYPLSELAIMAEIGIADAYFSDKEYVDAALSYNEFVNLHPLNKNVPYALYQNAMCHYQQIDTIDRDQTEALNAKRSFERMINRFPDSEFTPLAEEKIKECNVMLAKHELYVGRLYLKMKKYEAALRRFKTVTGQYAGLGLDKKTEELIKETQKRIAATKKSK